MEAELAPKQEQILALTETTLDPERFGFIFITFNNLNGMIYIGQTSRIDGNLKYYIGSGKYLKRAFRKYGKKNFTKIILKNCYSREELNRQEILYIKFCDSTNQEIGYNISKGGESGDYPTFHAAGRPKMKFTDEQVKDIIESYENWASTVQISKKYGIGYTTVIRVLKENGISIRDRYDCQTIPITKEQESEIISLYKSGMSAVDIGKKFNLSYGPIRRILKRNNVHIRTKLVERFATNSYKEKIQEQNEKRRLKIESKIVDKILTEYISGKSIFDLSKELSIGMKDIRSHLVKNNIDIRNKYESIRINYNKKIKTMVTGQESKIINLYNDEIFSTLKISRILSIPQRIVNKILKENNIPMRMAGETIRIRNNCNKMINNINKEVLS